jgi:hypothetical protein
MMTDIHEHPLRNARLPLECDVSEPRRARSRTERWLEAFHELSCKLGAIDRKGLIDQWVQELTGELAFQVAAVHAWEPSRQVLETLAAFGANLPPAPSLGTGVNYEYLLRFPKGTYIARQRGARS